MCIVYTIEIKPAKPRIKCNKVVLILLYINFERGINIQKVELHKKYN